MEGAGQEEARLVWSEECEAGRPWLLAAGGRGPDIKSAAHHHAAGHHHIITQYSARTQH